MTNRPARERKPLPGGFFMRIMHNKSNKAIDVSYWKPI
jgi:hypothetical protein